MYQLTHSPTFKNINLSGYEKIVLALFLYKDISEKDTFRKLNRENFSDWISLGHDFNMSNVLDGIHAIVRLNDDFNPELEEDVFYFLQRNFSSIAETSAKVSKEAWRIIWTLKDIPSDTDLSKVLPLFYKFKNKI